MYNRLPIVAGILLVACLAAASCQHPPESIRGQAAKETQTRLKVPTAETAQQQQRPKWRQPPSRTSVQARRVPGTLANLAPPAARPANEPEKPKQIITEAEVTRVALLLPFSGRHGELGRAMRNAAQLALFDLGDSQFELSFYDTKGELGTTQQVALKAIDDGASLIIGPLLASGTRVVAPIARSAQVPVVSLSNDITAAGAGIYIMGLTPETEVQRILGHSYKKGLRRFALLAPRDSYGERVTVAFRTTIDWLGAEVARIARYDPYTRDYGPIIRDLGDYEFRRERLLEMREELAERNDETSQAALERLESLQTVGNPDFEALLVADGGERLQSIAALLPHYDIDPKVVKILGTGRWDMPGVGIEPALDGGWFAAPDPEARERFFRRYEEVFSTPAPRLITLAYDATALAGLLVRGRKTGAGYSKVMLTQKGGFNGYDGLFRFEDSGRIERALAILRVTGRETRVVERAPKTFGAE